MDAALEKLIVSTEGARLKNRISQVKGQRIHFAGMHLFVLDFFFGAVDFNCSVFVYEKRELFHGRNVK